MKRVLIPVINGNLSELLSDCDYFEVFIIEGGEIWQDERIDPPSISISELPEWTSQKNITDVITHKTDPSIITEFTKRKINLFVGIERDDPEKIITDYLNGKLCSNESLIVELNK
jgi:hypothetical protein